MVRTIKLFNTLTRKKEELVPKIKGKILLYTCGPTVYNFAHIGNFRTYVFEDLLRRTLKFLGYQVEQVMNLTDVDDKTIKGALEKKITLDAFTRPYIDGFFKDLKRLNIEPAEHYPAATDYIKSMIKIIQGLIDKGYAYVSKDGSVYYSINKFPHYGCLSHLHLEELKVGASERVNADEYDKDSAADFVLWKSCDPERDGNIYWESPFGIGRPGWHIECSAMAMDILGPSIDIHCGGVDNMFPHHENEIAQSEAYTGSQFSTMWLHSEHLVVDGKKMSKSLGNFYRLQDLLDRNYTGIQIRYMLMQTHYKTQLNFSFKGLDGVKSTLNRLNDFITRLQSISEGLSSQGKVQELMAHALNGFTDALADDLNISVALAALFDFVREMNALCDRNQVDPDEAQHVLELMKRFDSVLGVLSFESKAEEIPQDLLQALVERTEARNVKDWALADRLRVLIESRGYVIEDSPQGSRLKKMDVHG